MTLKAELIDLASAEKVRTVYYQISKIQNENKRYSYFNELIRDTKIAGPTMLKILTKLVEANLLDSNWSTIRATETYISKKTNKEISRARKIWVKSVKIKNNNDTKNFNKLISSYSTSSSVKD